MSSLIKKKTCHLKVVLIGDSGVGKTAILKKYVDDEFPMIHKSTIGADFFTKIIELNDKIIKLQIWDTAGQERFESLGKSFYRGTDICCLVYSINDINSFNRINYWKDKYINESQQKYQKLLLLGNKCDLDDNREININDAQKYADDNKLMFYECSALTGKNIEKALTNICIETSNKENIPYFNNSSPPINVINLNNKNNINNTDNNSDDNNPFNTQKIINNCANYCSFL